MTFQSSISSLAQAAFAAYQNSNAYKYRTNLPLETVAQQTPQIDFAWASAPASPVSYTLPAGYTFIAEKYDPNDNYYGIAMRNTATGEIVVSHRGTENSSDDALADWDISQGRVPPGANDAVAFATQIANQFPDSNIINVGHSLGAYEAAFANAKLTDAANSSGQDSSRFAYLGLDTPGINPLATGANFADPSMQSYQGITIAATTDPVNQLTRAYGLPEARQRPWQRNCSPFGGSLARHRCA